jgi:hypothetical protein
MVMGEWERAAAPALVSVTAKFSPDQLADLFKHPTAKKNAGGMPPIDLPSDDLKALIAYVESLKYLTIRLPAVAELLR